MTFEYKISFQLGENDYLARGDIDHINDKEAGIYEIHSSFEGIILIININSPIPLTEIDISKMAKKYLPKFDNINFNCIYTGSSMTFSGHIKNV